MTQVLRLDDLAPYLLLRNGNLLYKVPYAGGWAVLKVYHGSRGFLETLGKSLGNVVFEGQTSYWPGTRRAVERACIELWRSHGFRVFDVYDVSVVTPGLPPDGYLLLEYVQAPHLEAYLKDEARPLARRLEVYRRWLAEWCQRHELAESLREPRLMHENGDGGHVFILDEGARFLWFDFEMVYRSRRRVREYVGHEIIQYLWHFFRNTPPPLHEALWAETVASYPDRERLRRAPDVFLAPARPLTRLGRAIERRTAKGLKVTSKYQVSLQLRERLGS